VKSVVTGGAGFIGSHLIDALMERGEDVVVIDNLHRGRLEHINSHLKSPRFTFIEGDIRDDSLVTKAFRDADVVYHLAAQSNVMGAYNDVSYSFTTNVGGTINVLKAASAAGVRRLVFTSSREAYGEQSVLPVVETASLNSKNLYGASKVAGESYCRAWRNTMGLECVVLRLANVYGPRDSERVIPLWLSQALANEDMVLFGGEQVLDFIWVGKVVDALVAATTCPADGPINIGSGQGTALVDLAHRIKKITRSESQVRTVPARSAEVVRFVADTTKMGSMLGLQAPADSLESLELMVGS
jgi:UDP-glucose 4-epimerase